MQNDSIIFLTLLLYSHTWGTSSPLFLSLKVGWNSGSTSIVYCPAIFL
jgi:hypothetical protein